MLKSTSQDRNPQVSRIVRPIAPFDFGLSLAVMSNGDPRVARYESGRYWHVLRINDMLVHATVRSIGSVTAPRLRVILRSESTLDDPAIYAAIRCLSSVLNADLDVKPFYRVATNDVLMIKLIKKLYGLKNLTTPTVFEALICSIIEQQISLLVAHSLERKMTRAFGDSGVVGDARYYAFPTAQQLARTSVNALHRCGISQRKAEYIVTIAKMIEQEDLDIEGLKGCDNTPAILDVLCSLRGVGRWTAELTALRGLNRLDVIPAADLGLERRWVAHYYCNDCPITSEHVRHIAERWNEWKGLAGYYLIAAGRLGVDVNDTA